jgi:hypothetical protein
MRLEIAIGLILEMCFRIFGLVIIIAESVVSPKHTRQKKYIREQRKVMQQIQDDIDLYILLGDVGE